MKEQVKKWRAAIEAFKRSEVERAAKLKEFSLSPKGRLLLDIVYFDKCYCMSDDPRVYNHGIVREKELQEKIAQVWPEEKEILLTGLVMGDTPFQKKYNTPGTELGDLLFPKKKEVGKIPFKEARLFEIGITDDEIVTYIGVRNEIIKLAAGVKNYGYSLIRGEKGPSEKEVRAAITEHGWYLKTTAVSRSEEDILDQIWDIYHSPENHPVMCKVRDKILYIYSDFNTSRDLNGELRVLEIGRGETAVSNDHILIVVR